MRHLQVSVLHATVLNQRGYSDVRLWPCYLVYTSAILFLAPFTGLLLAFTALSTLAFLIAIKVANPVARRHGFAIHQSVSTEFNYSPAVITQHMPAPSADVTLQPETKLPSPDTPTGSNAWVLTASSI